MSLSGLQNSGGALGAAAFSSPGEGRIHREGDQHPDPSLLSLRVFRSCSKAPSVGEAGLINVSPENTTLAPVLTLTCPVAFSSSTGRGGKGTGDR